MFHPTWDEWKRTHLNENNKTINNTQNDSLSFKQQQQQNESNETKDYKNMLDNNNNKSSTQTTTTTTTTTTRNLIQESSYTRKSSHNQNNKELIELNQMKQKQQSQNDKKQELPIVIHNNNKVEVIQTKKSSKHYPVYPYDTQAQRAPSPVHLSSVVLAKEPPLEVKTQNEAKEPESQVQTTVEQPKKIKTIMSTQRRKDSAPSLTGWRTESDSDTEIQNRLLAKASGSIPIEYISIRRDPKPCEKKQENKLGKKSITTGTNTSTDRGKKIASTNTDLEELPQFNLHLSLDSLFAKSKREASTSTERRNKNAATETLEIKHRDACTVTEPEPEHEPEQFVYTSRKSRYTEWETASNPPQLESYRLELLARSPRTLHRRTQVHTSNSHVIN